MTTPTSLQNTNLVLAPPFVQGATDSVIGARIGVPLAIYNLVPDGLGARVRIDPPLAGTVDPTDTIVLKLKGEVAPLDSKPVGNPDAPIEMRIPVGRLHSDRVNELYYEIFRNSQNFSSSTPMLEALFNMIRPGLKDVRPDIVGHSELGMTLPDEIKNGVGPGFVSAQVCFTYPYCRAYDTITLKCNGEIVTFEVGTNDAPQPPDPGSPAPTTVCFIVDRAFLDKAIRPSGKLDFSFTVTDQLLNTPDPDAVWSASQTVDEDLDGKRLQGVIYRERPNDPGDVSEIIDLELLGTNRLQVIVLTNDPRLLAGDVIDGTYTASAEGKLDVVVPLKGVVEADEFGQKKVLILWVDNNKVIAGSTVKSMYAVLRNGTSIGQSVAAMARVVGEGLPDLLPPRFQKSLGGVLDPLDPANLKGANGQVEVLGFRSGDVVKLIGSWAGSPTFDFKPLNSASRANFPLDSAFLAANMGKQLKLRYVLQRSGKLYDSQVLDASVKRIADHDPRLPVPTIDGNDTSNLDATKLLPSSVLQLPAYAHQVSGQSGWLRYEGVDSKGNPVFHDDLNGDALSAGPGLARPVPLTWLQGLMDGSVFTILFSLNYDGVANAGLAVKFPVRSYTVQAQPDVVVAFLNAPYAATTGEQVTGIELLVTQAGLPSAGQTVTITLPQGTTFAGGAGTKDFVTGVDGKIAVNGVKAGSVEGDHSITAVSGRATASARLSIRADEGEVIDHTDFTNGTNGWSVRTRAQTLMKEGQDGFLRFVSDPNSLSAITKTFSLTKGKYQLTITARRTLQTSNLYYIFNSTDWTIAPLGTFWSEVISELTLNADANKSVSCGFAWAGTYGNQGDITSIKIIKLKTN